MGSIYWLHHPNIFESAKVVIEEGLPVAKTLDWVELEFVEGGTPVPDDAWADWDPVEQRFNIIRLNFNGRLDDSGKANGADVWFEWSSSETDLSRTTTREEKSARDNFSQAEVLSAQGRHFISER